MTQFFMHVISYWLVLIHSNNSNSEGDPAGGNRRCNQYSFATRRDLFSNASNFLIVPGDNDWNECYGYDVNSNKDTLRELWRQYFALDSPFNQFIANFPGGDLPVLLRKTNTNGDGDINPELFYFLTKKIAVFGLNQDTGGSYIDNTEIMKNGSTKNLVWTLGLVQLNLSS